MTEVARRYRFRASHHIPSLPSPWDVPHEHDYTVEVIARGEGRIVVDTDRIDRAWAAFNPGPDLDRKFGPEQTTVEALAEHWLQAFRRLVPAVYRVVVWEDDDRWGAAE